MWTSLWEPLLRVHELAKKVHPGAQLRPRPLLTAVSHVQVLLTRRAGRVWSGFLQPFLRAGSWLCVALPFSSTKMTRENVVLKQKSGVWAVKQGSFDQFY